MVHAIKNEKQQINNSGIVDKKSPPILVHHQPDSNIPVYPVMTDLQFPPSPYHLRAGHSPGMQQPSHSPMMQQPSHSPMMLKASHSPMMQHSPVNHNHSPTVQPSSATFLSVASPFSNPPSPMAYSPANMQFTQRGGVCHMYPSPQEAIPNRPPPDYPYYGMTATTYSHDHV